MQIDPNGIKQLILEYDKPFNLSNLYQFFEEIKINNKQLILITLFELYNEGLIYQEENGYFYTDRYLENKRSR